MFVVATAGHVDHGKSTLVRALTGMEPDRFAEERRRGMTIDLGFAWTTLPGGADLAFVDVPGHQRFIANLLSGLGPVPAVLFVVAADEGWSRQSGEHLAALRALDVRHAVLAVTRSDLADPAPARAEALERLDAAGLADVDAVEVSGRTGAGLDDLRAALDRLLRRLPAADPAARVRLWVDRAFTIRGSGTVVTGTLSAGRIRAGDSLELRGGRVTVRSVQSLGRGVDEVAAVARVALNLRGVARDDVARGDVLTTPDAWHRTAVIDARVTAGDLPAELVLHVGTAGVAARLRPLGDDRVRVTLDQALPLQAGDRAVLRDPGRQSVAAGVLVLDADPPALRRRGAAARRAEELAGATGRPDPAVEIARRGAVRRRHLVALGVPLDPAADARAFGDWLVDPDRWQAWLDAAPTALAGWAVANPLEPAMPVAALARELRLPDPTLAGPIATAIGAVRREGRVSAADQRRGLGAAEASVQRLEARLAGAPFAAPDAPELAELRLGTRELAAAERAGRLLRITPELVLLPSAPARAVAALRALPQPFTVSEARQAWATSRRVALPLLAHLDALGLTERVDDRTRRVV
ncbi:MAG TPA: selenocysteine-specific translation elongation factor [Jatrophihabitans sp.]|uniref:selenocysteine-specific translation elongation factor n=1 Tax=Jatrophihabitans sp. TaxID=1932789 RepID=UPI002E0A7EFB|nr:selenocysteine-specific translation elongation factor [Jatrophihabitans sp.]